METAEQLGGIIGEIEEGITETDLFKQLNQIKKWVMEVDRN